MLCLWRRWVVNKIPHLVAGDFVKVFSVIVEVEFRVEFVDGLLEIGAVYAVVGADCRRDVFVAEQHLDDLRVFARLKEYT